MVPNFTLILQPVLSILFGHHSITTLGTIAVVNTMTCRGESTSSLTSGIMLEEEFDELWVDVAPTTTAASAKSSTTTPLPSSAPVEPLPDRFRRVTADLKDLSEYNSISISHRRRLRLKEYLEGELESLLRLDFDALDQQAYKVDFLLLRNFLRRQLRQLELQREAEHDFVPLLIPFAKDIITLYEARQDVVPLVSDQAAETLNRILQSVHHVQQRVSKLKKAEASVKKSAAYKAAQVVDELRSHLREWHDFYHGYHPQFDFWLVKPWQELDAALQSYANVIRQTLVGLSSQDGDDDSGDGDVIIGNPIGRAALLAELEAEMIPYTPEELLKLADEQFAWCEKQMKAAARELGFGDDWQAAMNTRVKEAFVPPGEQIQLVRDLAEEATRYVREKNLVTVPKLAESCWRTIMMSPEQQKVAPFFLGGPLIQVSYPTKDMTQMDKRMVMRGNNRHFSRATVFHELIPGHKLQMFQGERHNAHRGQLSSTPFFVEGWAMYWEMVLWDRGDFFVSPEDRIGTMFWRMHRCARIIFSLNFHLGHLTPQECVDLLVNKVGHERITAEGEVRRSFNGDWPPLYQAGYMLGALQLWELRREVLGSGDSSSGSDNGEPKVAERDFHDAIMRAQMMPIELLRALLTNAKLDKEHKTNWRFYQGVRF